MVGKAPANLRRWVALLVVPAAALVGLTAAADLGGHQGAGQSTQVLADLEWDVVPAGH
ncbi:hypothetical protein [Kitasatospora sp. KL5]|uniref:hypothetical protein n=1 Tax=Kitasatospora sp. KL5 TaxID=3425125 RepID=UPI003D6F61AE